MIITCNGFKYFYNKIIHGVDFEEVAECIFSTQAISTFDAVHSIIEDRYNLVTISPSGRILIVGFCKRQNNLETRIISARVAPRKARKQYEAKYPGAVFTAISHRAPLQKARFRIWNDIFIGVPLCTLEFILIISIKLKKWIYEK